MDTRLIQTAVLGDPESDEPVICPEDPEELEVFRLEHAGKTWWCGINLPGGCGRRLTTRLCTDKICHFAHVPDPHGHSDSRLPCNRRLRGKEDADHLFIKADIARWLRQQNIEADLALPEPLGSAVTVRLADGRLLIVHLDTERPPAWDDEKVCEYLLGPGCRISRDALIQRGQVFRIRMDGRSGRGRRFVVAGIERAGAHTRWFDLTNLRVTADGIDTVDEAGPLQPSQVSAVGAEQSPSDQGSIVALMPSSAEVPRSRELRPLAARRLDNAIYEESSARVKSALLSVEYAIANDDLGDDELAVLRAAHGRGQRWLEKRERLRKTVIAQLQERVDARKDPEGLARQARDLVGDEDATDEDRAKVRAIQHQMQQLVDERREAEARQKAKVDQAAAEADQAVREAMQRVAKERRRAFDQETARQDQETRIKALVLPVRGGLKRAAATGEMRTWQELQHKTGARGLKALSYEDRVALLVMVGQRTPADEPLWSVLLIAHGNQDALAMHRAVAAQLSRNVPENDRELIAQLTAQRAELHRIHR
ncbi:hypothetical protein ACH4RG_34850 [Streptomyces sp. NPDC021019]|uniref:hypothetical protein n=1 Tax=Streptomyces sp. NPDC021019 TaxID=3365108 RepID=UPI00378E680E